MKPIKFHEANVVYGENQASVEPLPALRFPTGEVVTCWELSHAELKEVQETGCIWLTLQTFNQPLQPVFLTVDKSDVLIENED